MAPNRAAGFRSAHAWASRESWIATPLLWSAGGLQAWRYRMLRSAARLRALVACDHAGRSGEPNRDTRLRLRCRQSPLASERDRAGTACAGWATAGFASPAMAQPASPYGRTCHDGVPGSVATRRARRSATPRPLTAAPVAITGAVLAAQRIAWDASNILPIWAARRGDHPADTGRRPGARGSGPAL